MSTHHPNDDPHNENGNGNHTHNHLSFSPSCHFSLAGTFNVDDIDDLLGAMAGEHQQHQQHQQLQNHDNHEASMTTTIATTVSRARLMRTKGNRRRKGDRNEEGDDDEEEEDEEEVGGEGDEDQEEGTTTNNSKTIMARSERKRSREKQRRCDVNRQFTDLTTVLKQIELEEAAENELSSSSLLLSSSSSTADILPRVAFSASNRVELIARTITHLERLNASNKRRKKEIDSLQQQLDLAKKAGEDTAAKLKEVMFNQPPPYTKQVCWGRGRVLSVAGL